MGGENDMDGNDEEVEVGKSSSDSFHDCLDR